MTLKVIPHNLQFYKPAGTSRGYLNHKKTWFIILNENDKIGVGEVSIIEGLSYDNIEGVEEKLNWLIKNSFFGFEKLYSKLNDFPGIQFGLEQAYLSLQSQDNFVLFPSLFTNGEEGILTNGLIWMGSKSEMVNQVKQKLKENYTCIKLKIGALDFDQELEVLRFIRNEFDEKTIEIRVDANGAFNSFDVLDKLNKLSEYKIHSIEQPIKSGQIKFLADLCKISPIPIALDEELIGNYSLEEKKQLLEFVKPFYIVLKPGLLGGFNKTEEWIKEAEKNKISWWLTSALESNVGLNAIAQYAFSKNITIPQGLGTGGLYRNNISSPLFISKASLWYEPSRLWEDRWIQLFHS